MWVEKIKISYFFLFLLFYCVCKSGKDFVVEFIRMGLVVSVGKSLDVCGKFFVI